MSHKIHVRVDDQVYVLTGKDTGKTGKIIACFPKPVASSCKVST